MYTSPVPTDATAVIGRRIGAFIVNLVIVLVVVFIGARAIADFKSEDIPFALQDEDVCELLREDNAVSLCFSSDDTVIYATGSNAALGVFVLPTVVWFANSVLLASFAGASVGKLLFGLRVVNKDTFAIAGFGKSLVRWLLWIVDAVPYCLPLVGLITGLATKGHRRVGDMAAGTLVVAKSSVGNPPSYPGAPGAPMGAAPMGWSPPGGGYDAPPAPGGYGPPPAPGGYGAPPAGQWAPPAPPADPWSPPAPPADPWSTPAAPAAPTWHDPSPPAVPAPQPEPIVEREPDPTPEPAAVEPSPVEPAPAEAAPANGPQWDAARNAYIQYEPVSGQWMQFDDAAQEWRPIS